MAVTIKVLKSPGIWGENGTFWPLNSTQSVSSFTYAKDLIDSGQAQDVSSYIYQRPANKSFLATPSTITGYANLASLPDPSRVPSGTFAETLDSNLYVSQLVNGSYTWNVVGGGGGSAFASLTSGTNSTAAMIVGTGASIALSGSGTIQATSVPGTGVTGTVAVANGGTGTTTPALVQGTNVTITGTWPNQTINSTASGASGANPTALAGLTAVNGAATTFLRSDGSPAIDQTIAPTWTAKHTHSLTMVANTAADGSQYQTSTIASAANQMDSPAEHFTGQGWATTPVASQPVDSRMYVRPVQGTTNPTGFLVIDYSVNGAAFADMLTIPLVSNGTAVLLGSLTVNGLRVQGASIPTNGLYLPGTNQLGFSTNGALKATIESTGQMRLVIVGVGYSAAEGTNAKQGVATLVGGTLVVSNTSVTANSRIFLTCQSLGTVSTPSALCVSARTAATSFTILASQATDTSVIAYEIFEPS